MTYESITGELDRVHAEIISEYRKAWIKRVLVIILPYIIFTAIFLFSKNYLLPEGIISEYHYYGEYEPITMEEIWTLFWFGQFITVVLCFVQVNNFLQTYTTSYCFDGHDQESFVVIGKLNLTSGVIYVGPKLHQKRVIFPEQYVNREGLTFADIDHDGVMASEEYLHKKDHMFDWLFSKSEITRYVVPKEAVIEHDGVESDE